MKIINSEITQAISNGKPIQLNLGAGKGVISGYYNVDLVELPATDIVADLNNSMKELPDNSVAAIYSRGCFEHIRNFMGLMTEIHRICLPEAEVKTIVPHFSNPYYYSDPTHVQPFGLYSMHYFMDEALQYGRKVPSYYTSARFSLEHVRIQFYRETLLEKILEPIVRRLVNINIYTQDIYERRFSYLYPAWQLTYILRVKK